MVSRVSQDAAQVNGALPVTCSNGEEPGKSASISTPTEHSHETPSSFPRQIKKNSVTMPQLLAADGVQENTSSNRDVQRLDAGVKRSARGYGQHPMAQELRL